MSATFPTSPAFNEQFIPPPPILQTEKLEDEPEYQFEYLKELSDFQQSQYFGLTKLQNSIASGWLISTLRVLDLTADTITAGSTFTQILYVGGSEGTGGITLDGDLSQIRITDGSDQDRFVAGDIGSGVWLQIIDSGGTVVFQSGTTTFINGAYITNATIDDSKLSISTLSQIAADLGSITAGSISSGANVNAGALKAGTITVDGSPAISITSSGAFVSQSGGDLILRATAGDDNYIVFQNSSSVSKGVIAYNSTSDVLRIDATGTGTDLQLLASVDVVIQSGTDDYVFGGQLASDIFYDADGIYDIGNTSVRAANVWSDLINGADYGYDNGVRATEPDKVYSGADPQDGILFMRPDRWFPFVWFHLDGTIQTTGFAEPDVAKMLPRDEALVKELEDEVRMERMVAGTYHPDIPKIERTITKEARRRERLINGRRPVEEAVGDPRRRDGVHRPVENL